MITMFISSERKISAVHHTGIQYIPGHVEPFVDFVVENYLPNSGAILDLGGGGLRFAIPVALKEKSITVVDLDKDALSLETIIAKVNHNGKMHIDIGSVKPFILTEYQDIFDYLENTNKKFSLITAFRIIHFLSFKQINDLLGLIKKRMEEDGVLVLSAMTPYNFGDRGSFNEIYMNSKRVRHENRYYRRIDDTEAGKKLKLQQSLPDYVQLIDKDLVIFLARCHGYKVVNAELKSTRIVEGHILSDF